MSSSTTDRRRRSRPAKKRATRAAPIARLYADVYAVVRRIPPGRIATYGQVAELAGIPGGARVAGAAMRASTPALALPWHRVVGKRSRALAEVRIHDPVGAAIQRRMLEVEGVEFTPRGGISLAEYGWLPGQRLRPRRRCRAR